MIKIVAAGLWMSATMLASGYGTTQYLAAQKRVGDAEPSFVGLDYETVDPINVPILADGVLQGYVVIKMVFTADGDTLRRLPVPPHPFLIDEAFRVLYSDETLDFRGLERYDLETFKNRLKQSTNDRLGQDIVHDVLVEEFNYFDKADVITH